MIGATQYDEAQLTDAFHVCLHVPWLQRPEHFAAVLKRLPDFGSQEAIEEVTGSMPRPIGVQQLLFAAEIARQRSRTANSKNSNNDGICAPSLLEALRDSGYDDSTDGYEFC